MKINIQSVNFTAADHLKDFIQQKMDKLDHYFDRITDGQVYLKVEKDHENGNKLVEIKVNVPGSAIMATERAETFEAAIDVSMDKLRQQVIRYKEKMSERA